MLLEEHGLRAGDASRPAVVGDIGQMKRLAALGALHDHMSCLPTVVVEDLCGNAGFPRLPTITPGEHGEDDRYGVFALLGQLISVTVRPVFVGRPLDQAVLDERVQSVGEESRPSGPRFDV